MSTPEMSLAPASRNNQSLPERMRSLTLRAYPWSTGIVAHPHIEAVFDSESGYSGFVNHLVEFEKKFFATYTYDAMAVRKLLQCSNENDNLNISSLTMPSAVHKHRMLDLFVSYRVLDMLTSTKAIPELSAVPSHMRATNLGTQDKPGWHHMNDWKALLNKFQGLVSNLPQPLPQGPRTYASQVAKLGHLLSKNAANKIFLNFQIAAMHLADVLGGVDFLDSSSPSFLEKFLDKASNTLDKAQTDPIRALTVSYQPNQLRLPLHAAVLISPLCLLAPIQLFSKKWERNSMFLTSKALGNCRPTALAAVENQLMAALLRLARLETDLDAEMIELSSWLKDKMPDITGEVPDSNGWFKSNPSTPRIESDTYMQITGVIPPGWDLHVLQVVDGDVIMQRDDHASDDGANADNGKPADDRMDIVMTEEGSTGMVDDNALAPAGASTPNRSLEDMEMNTDDRHSSQKDGENSNDGHNDHIGLEGRKDNRNEDGEEEEEEEEEEDVEMATETNAGKVVEGTEDGEPELEDEEEEDGGDGSGDSCSEKNPKKLTTKLKPQSEEQGPSRKEKGEQKKQRSQNSQGKREKAMLKILSLKGKGWGKGKTDAKAGMSKEYPIDVDRIRIFDKREKSLVHETTPKKYGSSRPVTVYGPDGTKTSITFALHLEEDIMRLHAFADALKASFVSSEPNEAVDPVDPLDPLPAHVGKPEASIFHVVSEAEFNKLPAETVLGILSSCCIIVTDRAARRLKFDAKGLKTLSPLSTVVPIQDQSRRFDEVGSSYNNRVLLGTLRQLLDCSRMEGGSGKILNALYFPLAEEGLGSNPFSTDTVAWRDTKGRPNCDESVQPPTADIRWGLAATTGAVHWWHIDSDGFGTYIDVKAGKKWWIVARPKKYKNGSSSSYDFSEFARIDLFTRSDYAMEDPNTSTWDLEAVLLTPGTRLIMRPNLPHAVYTPEHAICHGGHFYAISTIQDTMFGLVHSFVAGNFITNTDHVTSRLLLRRMALFYHGAFVLGLIDEEDRASNHIPDLGDFKSFLDILALCNIIILMNALDGRTYYRTESKSKSAYKVVPITVEERLSCIYARGKSIELLNWIAGNYMLELSGTNDRDGCFPMMVAYFRQQVSAIKAYKDEAEKTGILGSETSMHCSGGELDLQLAMATDIFPESAHYNSTDKVSMSLAWDGPPFDVVLDGDLSSKEEQNFMYYSKMGALQDDKEFLARLHNGGDDGSSAEQGDRLGKRRRT